MNKNYNKKGFSLAEVLMAMGILSIAMLFIAAVFPAGLYFTTIATERSIASTVADYAFNEIWLTTTASNAPPFNPVVLVVCNIFPHGPPAVPPFVPNAFLYEGDPNTGYSWSAIWRRLPDDTTGRNVQVTVFISRIAGLNSTYYKYDSTSVPPIVQGSDVNKPSPVPVNFTVIAGNQITITNPDHATFLTEGCSIIDNETGLLYRVLSHDPDDPKIVILDRLYVAGINTPLQVWVVPPPVAGGRPPCIAVFQKIIRF